MAGSTSTLTRLIFATLLAITEPLSAEDIDRNGDGTVNILLIGNTHSFSEGGESGVVHEKPFNPTAISNELQSILSLDSAISATVNVAFEDIYKTKSQSVNYSGSQIYDFTSRCYSLAQHYMWPEGKTTRLANLRGADSIEWDYVILMADAYVMANFPGMYAEGVKLMVEEIEQGTAEPILFAQWPENTSSFSALDFNEVVYRVGNSAGVTVVPGGKAWSTLSNQDTSSSHPTPKGAYLAAASIYSELCDKNAKTSAYLYIDSATTEATADHALSTVQANQNASQYSGAYAGTTVFSMKYVKKRTISFRETGTSTENRIRDALNRVDDRCRVTFTTGGPFWDFNYGRGNDWWEDSKDYEVNPALHDRSYGFPMHHYTVANAINTMPYGIDKHYSSIYGYEDGTDLGIAYNMIRPGTRELSLPEDVRAVPIRLLWLKMSEQSPGFNPLGDNTHMHANLNDATAAYMYTLLSGRCPIVDEPADQSSSAWMQWLGHKVGYETAWQMSHLTTRSPGLQVFPSATSATSVTPTTTETMTVRFMNPPQSDVIVNVSSSSPSAAIVGPQTLLFTPSNYNIAQEVTVAGIPGNSSTESFDVIYSTNSDDEVFDGLSDSWNYSTVRSSTVNLSQIDNGVSRLIATQNIPGTINLNATGANISNTILVGPSHGSLTWIGDGLIEYTPSVADFGSDLIVYASTVGSVQTIGSIKITLNPSSSSIYTAWANGSFAHPFTDTGVQLNDDGDSISNLLEFAFGTDPTLSDGNALMTDGSKNGQPVPVTTDGGVTFDFYFIRRDDHGSSGSLSYTVQFSGDLLTFHDSSTTPTFVSDSNDDPAYHVVKLPYPATLPDGQKATFGRVRVNVEP